VPGGRTIADPAQTGGPDQDGAAGRAQAGGEARRRSTDADPSSEPGGRGGSGSLPSPWRRGGGSGSGTAPAGGVPAPPRASLVRKSWMVAHQQWLRGLRLEHPAEKAHRRRSGGYRRMTARGKKHNKVVVAIARELVDLLCATLAVEELATETGRKSPMKSSRTNIENTHWSNSRNFIEFDLNCTRHSRLEGLRRTTLERRGDRAIPAQPGARRAPGSRTSTRRMACFTP